MLDSKYIYDIDATTIPLSKELLSSCIDRTPIFSFVLCKYENLITTINTINRADEISGTLNGGVLFDSINSPETSYDCAIKIEGLKKSDDNYLDAVLRSNDKFTWTDFKTYSSQLRSEIRGMKEAVFRSSLWNSDNLDSWWETTDMQLPDTVKSNLYSDWPTFRDSVVKTSDREGYISACSDESKGNYVTLIQKNAKNLLDRYKIELMAHVNQKNKNDDTVTIKKPVVNKIYIMSNLMAKCQKEWPTLRISALNKKNLETLGLYL